MTVATDGGRTTERLVRRPILVESPPPAPSRLDRYREIAPAVLVAVALVAGAALRVFAFARNPSLWIDEAMLALNVVPKSAADLLGPLDWNQGAPVGYLMLAKAAVAAFGGSEYALRLPSLVAGLAGLLLFVPLAYRTLPLNAARLAVGLFAVSPYLIGYSAEFKQYELDATIAVGLTLLGLPVWQKTAGRWRVFAFAVSGAVAVWFSHPATFVLGGVGLAALADAAARRDRAALWSRAAVVGVWLVSFAVCYALFLRKLGMNDYLLSYWDGKFLPLAVRPGTLAWVVHHFFEFFDKPGGMTATVIAASGLAGVLYLIGAMALARADWRLLVALATPLFLAMAASALKKYPFAGRLLLFAVPAALMLVAYGTAVVASAVGRAVPGGGGLLICAVLLGPLMQTHWQTKVPLHAEDTREILAHAHANWQPGDRAYVFWAAVPALRYYAPAYPFPEDSIVCGVERRDRDPVHLERDLDGFRGSGRVWVIVAHRQTSEEAAVRAYLDAIGTCEETFRRSDAVAFRYDLRAAARK